MASPQADLTLEQLQERLQKVRTVEVLFLVVLATLVSTGASIGGGLVMYYESLASLQNTMRETSKMEIDKVSARVDAIVYGTEDDALHMYFMLTRSSVPNDPHAWANLTRNFAYGYLSAKSWSYGLGLILYPNNPDDPDDWTDFVYLGMWTDPMQDGSQVLTAGLRYPSTDPAFSTLNATDNETGVATYNVDRKTGRIDLPRLSTINLNSYAVWARDPLDNGFHPPPDVRPAGRPPFLDVPKYIRHRKVATWFGPDKVPYQYSGWDILYDPPPPPHPWSGYKKVFLCGWYIFNAWEDAMRDALSDGGGLSTIVIYNAASKDVYASTEGEVLDRACFDHWYKTVGKNSGGFAPCSMSVDQTSAAVQEGLAVMEGHTEFNTIKANGEEFFSRWRAFSFSSDVSMLWMRPTSAVQDEVSRALLILVVFSVAVFLFDLVIAFVEIMYVVMPLRSVSTAIAAIGYMDTEHAQKVIQKLARGSFMVTEIRMVTSGVTSTLRNLEEYKSFLPAAVMPHQAKMNYSSSGRPSSADTATQPPTGEVAIVFTDIVGSTNLWEESPTAMSEALDIHFRVIRSLLASHNGYEVKTIGDAMMASFQSPTDALNFGAEVQEHLMQEVWPEDLGTADIPGVYAGLQLRIGVHYGPVDREVNPLTGRSDYRAATVNKAARLEGVALPGMTVLSEEMKTAVSASVHSIHTLGDRMLKGIGNTKVYYVLPKSLAIRGDHFVEKIQSLQATASPKVVSPPNRRLDSIVGGVCVSPAVSELGPAFPQRKPSRSNGVKSLRLAAQAERTFGAYAVLRFSITEQADVPSGGEFFTMVNHVLQRIFSTTTMTDGKVTAVVGSAVGVSWGVLSRVSQVALQCLRFTGTARQYLRAFGVEIGAAIGPMLYGNVGSKTKRYHTIVGTGALFAERLVDKCSEYGATALVAMADCTESRLLKCCVPVDVFSSRGHFGPFVVIESVDMDSSRKLFPSWDEADLLPSDYLGDDGGEDEHAARGELRKALLASAHENSALPEAHIAFDACSRISTRLAGGQPAARPLLKEAQAGYTGQLLGGGMLATGLSASIVSGAPPQGGSPQGFGALGEPKSPSITIEEVHA